MASIKRAQGMNDFSSAAVNAYTPQLYALELLEKHYLTTVLTGISNTKYEGTIKKHGDKVIIRTRPDVATFEWYPGMSLRGKRTSPESPAIELEINKGRAYSLNLDALSEVQSDVDLLDEWYYDAGQQMSIAIDRIVLNDIDANADTKNKGATAGYRSSSYNLGATSAPVVITKANALDLVADFAAVLSEYDVPEEGRWLVLPVWYTNLLEKGDLRNASVTGDTTNKVIRNGFIGEISNFKIYKSNNYEPVVDGSNSCYNIVFGHKSALTYASQLIKNRKLEDPDSFATLLDGLQVYGYEVVKPTCLGVGYVTKG